MRIKTFFLSLATLIALSFQNYAAATTPKPAVRLTGLADASIEAPFAKVPDSLNVLFIGNSFTFRNDVPALVKRMVEDGHPNLKFTYQTVTYGGRILKDHWRLRTQNFIRQSVLSFEEEKSTIEYLKETIAKDSNDIHAVKALERHQGLLKDMEAGKRQSWDIVVLQSWRDDYAGAESEYIEYAPRFAEIIKSMGAVVVLYETAPLTQNAQPLTSAPDRLPVLEKEKHIAELAKRINATVVPMPMVVLECQTRRPDFTLRYINDGHPNQTMAYLAACTFYSAIFGKSPEGLPLDRVKDTASLPGNKNLDPNGDPIEKVFSDKDRADLQKIVWEGIKSFHESYMN